MLFINFKAYLESTGDNAVKLAELCNKISKETGKEIILCVQAVDIFRVSYSVGLQVFSQHADPEEFGAHTGAVLIDSLKKAGAVGTIINHSEKRLPFEQIKKIVDACKKKSFGVLVCCQDAKEVRAISSLKPDYVAYEPPELIGGNISVSTAKPEVIKESVLNARPVTLIVGAGVKNSADVSTSVKLGAKGVLVASGVVKAENQEAAIKDLLKGL